MIHSRPVLTLMVIGLALTPGAWQGKRVRARRVGVVSSAASMLQPRPGQTATLLPDGRVLIVGGMRRNQDVYKSADLYVPVAGKFVPSGEMSAGRVGHVAVLIALGQSADRRRLDRQALNRQALDRQALVVGLPIRCLSQAGSTPGMAERFRFNSLSPGNEFGGLSQCSSACIPPET